MRLGVCVVKWKIILNNLALWKVTGGEPIVVSISCAIILLMISERRVDGGDRSVDDGDDGDIAGGMDRVHACDTWTHSVVVLAI